MVTDDVDDGGNKADVVKDDVVDTVRGWTSGCVRECFCEISGK